MIKLLYIDLFCGAGGTSTGVENARYEDEQCAKVVACVNHDANAIASHAANHPDALHFTEDIRTSQSLIFNCTYEGFPKGAIIGSVVISDCVQNHPSVWAEKGCWNWVLKDAVLFDKPIEGVKGKLGFWNYNLEEEK